MIFNRLVDYKILVVGLGISGMSSAIKLQLSKANVVCWDDDEAKRKKAIKRNLKIEKLDDINFKQINLVLLSPGIPSTGKKKHLVVKLAVKYNCKIISDLELLEYTSRKIKKIGVTGTNGKSTTSKMIEHIIKNSEKNVHLAGNIGIPVADLELNKSKESPILVIEASSFQLERVIKLRFDIALVLNLSEDHLDRHFSVEKYLEAKSNIFNNQNKYDYSIVCIDDKVCENLAKELKCSHKSKIVEISTNQKLSNGIFLKETKNKLNIFNEIDKKKLEIKKSDIRLFGSHNNQNILACYTVCKILNIEDSKFLKGISNFDGLEHRLENFKNFQNVCFFNDSKSTNLSSSKVALRSLKNIFWLVGGRSKIGGLIGIDNYLRNVKKAFIFGEAKKEFSETLYNKIEIELFDDLNKASEAAFSQALRINQKVNILLSPACSSFDQFKNFEERGSEFKKNINNKISNLIE